MKKFAAARQVDHLSAERRDDLVRYLTVRLANSEDARDLAQEAYLRLLRLEHRDLIRNPEAYLFRIATNLIQEHWLKSHRSAADPVDLDTLLSTEDAPDVKAGRQEELAVLERILLVLPPLQQQVVLKHRRDGMTYGEIADDLKISTHMVKKYLIKGLARCREQLQRYRNE